MEHGTDSRVEHIKHWLRDAWITRSRVEVRTISDHIIELKPFELYDYYFTFINDELDFDELKYSDIADIRIIIKGKVN